MCKCCARRIAHARIVSIDTSAAEQIDGVEGVITSADVPGEDGFGVFVNDQPIMARDKVRYVGEAVAAVAAVDLLTAKRALAAIKVEYAPLPAVFDVDAAMTPGAPVLHDYAPDNLTKHIPIRVGDVERGFAQSDLVVEETYSTQAIEHAYLEPEAGLAYVDHDDVVTIVSPSQNITHHRHMLARILAKPISKVRFIMSPVGGGFGGKEDMIYQGMLALLAMKTRAPVRLVFTREELIVSTAKRHPSRTTLRMGLTRDGRILASHMTMVCDGGAYGLVDRRRHAQGRHPRRRALRHPQCARRHLRHLYQQHAVRRLPLLRRAANAICHRIASRHLRRAARPRSLRDQAHQRHARRRDHAHEADARLGQPDALPRRRRKSLRLGAGRAHCARCHAQRSRPPRHPPAGLARRALCRVAKQEAAE